MSSSVDIESLRYPIGKFHYPKQVSKEDRVQWIDDITNFPKILRTLTADLSDDQLQLRYRPDGWTIQQVIHHTADSHMNALIRFKLAMTEDTPVIKPYLEGEWANLADSTGTISMALTLLDGLHGRWSVLLKSMSNQDFNRKLYHPEHKREFSLDQMLALYSWHCRHHSEHIKLALR